MSGAAAVGPSTGARDLLRLPDFRRLWSAQAISDLGDSLTSLALLLLVNALTASTAALAIMAIVLASPQVILGVAAGIAGDQLGVRTVFFVAGLLALAAAMIAALLYRGAVVAGDRIRDTSAPDAGGLEAA